MNTVYLLYGVICGAEELLGIYSTYVVAAEVGRAFVSDDKYEKYNIEQWKVLSSPVES